MARLKEALNPPDTLHPSNMRTFLVAALALPVAPLSRAPDVDPCEEQADLSPAILDIGDQCGWSVAAEGSRMAVGAPFHDGKGAVFIYSFNGTTWTLDSTIIPNQVEAGDQFGYSLSLNGGLLAVGAVTDDTAGTDAGAVYVLEEVSSTQWAIQAKLLPTEGGAEFGESISIWDDTIAVGQQLDARVYVFRQSGSNWVQEGDEDGPPFDSPGFTELTAVASSFGEAVSVYQNTLLVGDDDYTTFSQTTKLGRAYVYTRVGSTWTRAEEDIENPSAESDAEHFGESVALHGRWAVIGAPQHDFEGAGGQGVVHTFRTDEEGVYQEQGMLIASDGAGGDLFGTSVALRAGVLLVGAPNKLVDSVPEAGAAYQFNYIDGSWSEVGVYDPGDLMQNDRFGSSVAVGSYSAIGAPGQEASGVTGRAFIWSFCE